MDLNTNYVICKEQYPFINKVLFLIGCYPSDETYPQINHEYPLELLDYLGNNTLVFLIDPLYRSKRSRTFKQNLEVRDSNIFIQVPFLSNELEYDNIQALKFILSFTGLNTPFDILDSCKISYTQIQDYNVLYLPQKYFSSCYLNVREISLFPLKDSNKFVNKTADIINYIFGKTDITQYTQDAYFLFSYLFEQYSSWLRREAILQKEGKFEFGTYKKIFLKSMITEPEEFYNIYKFFKFHMYVLDNLPYETFFAKFKYLVEKGLALFGDNNVNITNFTELVQSSNILQEKLNRVYLVN